MSKLRTLRSQLGSLRRSRQSVRLATALAAIMVAVTWTLAGIFAIDLLFHWSGFPLDPMQRLLLLIIGFGVLAWAYVKYSAPFLGQSETELEMALFVERQQGIESDLVAALQFETPKAKEWGSEQLEGAVIDYVADLGKGLNVYEGFSRTQMMRRAMTLVGTVVVAASVTLVAGDYVGVFLNRLLLGSAHYPSDTQIRVVTINKKVVLKQNDDGTRPNDAKSAQGKPVVFGAFCMGKDAEADLPDEGKITLISSRSGQSREVTLEKRSRLAIEDAAKDLKKASSNEGDERVDLSTHIHVISAVVPLDSAVIKRVLATPTSDAHAAHVKQMGIRIDELLKEWPAEENTALYTGKLPRMVENVDYHLAINDAFTDSAKINLIPLPVIQVDLNVTPPKYARNAVKEDVEKTALQRSVMEGSRIEVAIDCTNKKPLKEAILTITDANVGEETKLPQEIKLVADADNLRFTLPIEGTAFEAVSGPIRYEVQVTDEDDLQLEVPLRGSIRIERDRRPNITGSVVHRGIVTPAAKVNIDYRASDDYGIASIKLHVSVSPAQGTPFKRTYDVFSLNDNQQKAASSLKNTFALDLTSLRPAASEAVSDGVKIAKGDEISLVLEAVDYRGDSGAGQNEKSDPLVLEVADSSSVLAVILEPDERLEKSMNNLSKTHLIIGESP